MDMSVVLGHLKQLFKTINTENYLEIEHLISYLFMNISMTILIPKMEQ